MSIFQASESGASWDCNVLESFTIRKNGEFSNELHDGKSSLRIEKTPMGFNATIKCVLRR